MAGSVLGEKVLRKEDPKFLTTGGVYVEDFTDRRPDGAVHVVFARSPVAHGTINSMITADLLPQVERIPMETPTPVNPLGAKGIGEAGTIGSTPAVHSAVVDALGHLGVRHIDMPCTPEKVWRAIEAASN